MLKDSLSDGQQGSDQVFEGPGYVHNVSGGEYAVLQSCSIKIGDYWVDGVVYLRNSKMFARVKSDFQDSFTPPQPTVFTKYNRNRIT